MCTCIYVLVKMFPPFLLLCNELKEKEVNVQGGTDAIKTPTGPYRKAQLGG